MDCPTVQDLSVAFLESELSPGETEQFTDHIDRCETCADRLARLAAQDADLASLPPPPDPRLAEPGFWDRMDEALATEAAHALAPPETAQSVWRRPLHVSPLGLMAYAAALLLAIAWGWMQHQDAQASAALAEAMQVELEQERRLSGASPEPVRVEQYRPVSYTPRRGTF